MRTTINISDALLAELKARASAEKKTFRQTLESVLQKGLASPSPTKCIKIETSPVGVKVPYQAQSMNQLYDQLETDSFVSKVAAP
jgi:hypothetical protein